MPLDPVIPRWGDSRYVGLRLRGQVRLADALNHLYVLLPVLDNAKHYWVSTDEVDKLIRAGAGWLGAHPDRDLITRRYLAHRRELVLTAVGRLAEADDTEPESLDNAVTDDEPDEAPERQISLAAQRRGAVVAVLRAAGAATVADLGCGEGALVGTAARRPRVQPGPGRRRVAPGAGAGRAAAAPGPDAGPAAGPRAIAAVVPDLPRRAARGLRRGGADGGHRARRPAAAAARWSRRCSARRSPATVVVTTPNAEHNVRFADLAAGRDAAPATTGSSGPGPQFRGWADAVAGRARLPGQRTGRSGRTTPRSARRPRWRCSPAWLTPRCTPERIRHPEMALVVLVGVSGSGKSTFARTALRADRGDLQRLLPRPGRRRRERPGGDRGRVRRAALHRGQAAGRRAADRGGRDQRAARRAASRSSSWPARTTCCRSRSCWTCRSEVCARAERRPSRPDFGAQVVRRQHDQLRRSLRVAAAGRVSARCTCCAARPRSTRR